ncbi:transposase [Ruegeria sp. ANG-R]|uniref:transposase n=1 Tax=Ruegeria sp. ANG-R TaxID=1577903 RepID=UPI00069204C4|nr:transposase [Ruegeria sp. ANG-R]
MIRPPDRNLRENLSAWVPDPDGYKEVHSFKVQGVLEQAADRLGRHRSLCHKHCWARALQPFGHDVRPILSIYLKPFVQRHKDDAAIAKTVTEAALRPDMSFFPETYETQAVTMMASRLRQTMPGIGPFGVWALETIAPDMMNFKTVRDFAVGLELIPLQRSTGGKTELRQSSK